MIVLQRARLHDNATFARQLAGVLERLGTLHRVSSLRGQNNRRFTVCCGNGINIWISGNAGTSARRSGMKPPYRRALRALIAILLFVVAGVPAVFAQGNTAPSGTQSAAPPAAPPAAAAPPSSTAAAPSTPAALAPAPPTPTTNAVGGPPPAPAPSAQDAAAPPGEHSVTTAELPQDLSPWGMFVHADIIVKAVMIGLAIASLVTWTVWVAKSLELHSARVAVRQGLRVLGKCATLAQAYEQLHKGTSAIAQLMQAAVGEIRQSANLRGDGLKERIAWQLERIEMAAGRKISRGTGVLATIGSTAPFVGLFGTVWGIMDSFIGISKAHTTNLAVVAPGIAEALLATALGLVAAIPAVMIYNVLARSTAHYRALIGDASAQVMKLVSRDLDRAKLPKSEAKSEVISQAAE
jgi:biopolymer transport protein ExbB